MAINLREGKEEAAFEDGVEVVDAVEDGDEVEEAGEEAEDELEEDGLGDVFTGTRFRSEGLEAAG